MTYAPITWSTVEAVARDVPNTPLEFQVLILGYVEESVAPSEFGGDSSFTYTLARAYVAAHYAAMHARGASGPAGATTSMSEGGVSVGFQAFSWSPSLFGETSYGRAFLSLIGPSVAGFVTG